MHRQIVNRVKDNKKMEHSSIMDKTQKHLLISGHVQGVGFRHYTRQNARELGIKGWVKNLGSGDVEAVLEGSEKDISKMMERLESGPRQARVEQVREVEDSDKIGESFEGFSVRR